MKKILTITLAIALNMLVLGFGIANANIKDKKVLVVYYSITNNTKAVAESIQRKTGGDIFRLETVSTYPEGYNALTQQAKKEIAEGYRPQLKAMPNNLSNYDVIFIGSPCWWSTYAPAVASFLDKADLNGKIIVPFMTHGGSGMGRSESELRKQVKNAKQITKGLPISSSYSNRADGIVSKFIDNLGL